MVTGQDRVQATLFAMQVALEPGAGDAVRHAGRPGSQHEGIRGAPRRAREFRHHNAALSFQ
jgi:hypothetical protein